jgi:altronate hydrolase
MQYIQLNEKDNVVVAIAMDAIPAGHKMAIRDIPRGSAVIKYGFPIGNATVDIKTGEHVHIHNLSSE